MNDPDGGSNSTEQRYDKTENHLRWIRLSLTFLAIVILGIILKELRVAFIPLVLAVFLTLLFAPFHRFLEKNRVPLGLSIALTFIIILLVFFIVGVIVYAGVQSLADQEKIAVYEERIIALVEQTQEKWQIPMDEILFPLQADGLVGLIEMLPLKDVFLGTVNVTVGLLLNTALTIIFMMFIVISKERFIRRILGTMTREETQVSFRIYDEVERQISRWLMVKTMISLATGLAGMIFIYFFRIDFIIISGLLLFVLNYIPNIGSIVASAFPILVSFLQYGLGWQTWAISGALLVIQGTLGQILEPRFMGTNLNLSPVIILFALIAWAYIWGAVGMVLAVPILSAISIIAREFESGRVLSAILSDD